MAHGCNPHNTPWNFIFHNIPPWSILITSLHTLILITSHHDAITITDNIPPWCNHHSIPPWCNHESILPCGIPIAYNYPCPLLPVPCRILPKSIWIVEKTSVFLLHVGEPPNSKQKKTFELTNPREKWDRMNMPQWLWFLEVRTFTACNICSIQIPQGR